MKFSKQTDEYPKSFYAFIEIPQGSSEKYEYNEELECVALDRFLFTSMKFPANYGFVIKTRAKDGDPLDVFVLSSAPIALGVAVKCKPVGVMKMSDEEGVDNKILAVPVDKVDPASSMINGANDIPEYIRNKIKHFLEHYKELEKGKFVKLEGFGTKEEAIKMLEEAKE